MKSIASTYELESMALKLYLEAAYDNNWLVMFLSWAVVLHLERDKRG